MQELICIIGTDGSGKTTLSDAVVDDLNAGGTLSRRVWLGAESYLMAPVRSLLKLAWRGRRSDSQKGIREQSSGSRRKNYAKEIGRKNDLAKKYPWATAFYLALVWTDYRIQIAIKRWRHRDCAVIVADRYLFDVAVNVGLTLGWTPEEVVRFTRSRLGKLPLPQYRVFLRVEPEVSLTRKDDIHDVDYLRLRLSYYDAIARAFGFVERDGTLPIAANCEWLSREARAELARPLVMYVHANNADIGGADKVLALMAEHMRDFGRPEKGNRVSVCLRLQTEIVKQYSQRGIPVLHGNFVRPQVSRGVAGLFRLVLKTPASLFFFWRLFGRERPDIVHVNDLYDFIPVAAARMRGIPVVWHIRMIVTRPALRKAFARLVSRLSPTSISVSHAVRDHYFPKPVPAHEAYVIHDLGNAALIADDRDPGVPSARPKDLPSGDRLVLMVGRIEPWKGQHVFVDAVTRLPEALRSDTVFALVGGGVDAKESYHEKVTRNAKDAGILVLGPRADVPDLLRAADISVHASVSPDPFPGVVIESMLAGAATIAARAGGATEMINDGVTGLLTEPGNAPALAAALKTLLDAPVTPRARFGARARARAISLVDAHSVDHAIQNIYEKLTANRSQTRT